MRMLKKSRGFRGIFLDRAVEGRNLLSTLFLNSLSFFCHFLADQRFFSSFLAARQESDRKK